MASITRPITKRALHLRTQPRPTNLGESREILRLISEFGEVEYFKNLKYDALSHPEAALVIFKAEEAAHSCLKSCPLRFTLNAAPKGGEPAPAAASPTQGTISSTPPSQPASSSASSSSTDSPQTTPFHLSHTRSYSTHLPIPPPRPHQTPFQPPPSSLPSPPSRIYQIIASPARTHFRDHINTGPYYGHFRLDTSSAAARDLAKRVPVKGFSCVDWRKEDRLWKVARREREGEAEGVGRRKTLGEVWVEGEAEG